MILTKYESTLNLNMKYGLAFKKVDLSLFRVLTMKD